VKTSVGKTASTHQRGAIVLGSATPGSAGPVVDLVITEYRQGQILEPQRYVQGAILDPKEVPARHLSPLELPAAALKSNARLVLFDGFHGK
jgi:hypothetical protein